MIKTSPHLPKYNIIKSVHILYIQKQPEALYLFPHKLAGTWWISKAVEDSPKIMMCAIHSVHSLSLNIMSTSMQQNQFPCWPYRLSPTWWLHSCRWVIWSDHNIIHCHLCISLLWILKEVLWWSATCTFIFVVCSLGPECQQAWNCLT